MSNSKFIYVIWAEESSIEWCNRRDNENMNDKRQLLIHILKPSLSALTLNAFMQHCTHTFSRPRKASSSSPHRMLLLWIVRANGLMGRLAEDKRDSTLLNLNVILRSTRRAHDRLTKTANCLLWWVRKSAVSYKSTEKETMWQTCWNIVNFSNVYSWHDVNQRAGNFNQF